MNAVNLMTNEYRLASDFHFKRLNWFGGRHTERFSGHKIETRSVAGTDNRTFFDASIGQWLPIMGAYIFNRQKLILNTNQESRCIAKKHLQPICVAKIID